MRPESPWRRRLGWALVLAAPAIELWHICRYAVNVLVWDEWALVPFLREVHEGGDWWPWIFRQHNEHRVAALRLPLVLISEWWDWNVIPQMVFSFLLQIVTLVGLWRIFADRLGRDPLRFAPIAFLTFGLINYTIFLYGMMYVWSMLVAATVWSLWLLSRQTWPGLAGAIGCGVVASYTIINGLLVWPIGLLLLFLGKDSKARRLLWLAVGIAVFVLYFGTYVQPGHPSPLESLQRPLNTASFLLALLGASFGAGSYWASFAVGAALVVLVLLVWGQRLPRRHEWSREERVVFGLLVFGLTSAVAVTVSRVVMDRSFANVPRYVIVTVMVSVALYFELFGKRNSETRGYRPLALAFAAMLVVGFAATTVHARRQLLDWSELRHRQVAQLAQFDRLSDAELLGIFPVPSRLREFVAYMRPRRLGVFRHIDTRDAPGGPPASAAAARALYVQRWREGTPAAEIIPGREVVQRFRCPVENLTELAVPFATYDRQNRGHVTVVLAANGAELGRNRVPAATIQPNGWVTVTPRPALHPCYGRELTLTVRSDDAALGSALTVWTYPAYYEGDLFQRGGPDFSGRCLGLEINRATN